MIRTIATLIAMIPLVGYAAVSGPLVYLPFDRDAVVGIGRLDETVVLPEPSAEQTVGIRGECLHIASDLCLPTTGNFLVAEGTVAFWMRASWQNPDTGHTLFCLYGGEPPEWGHNRWSIWANDGHVSASLYPKAGQEHVSIDAETSVSDGQWHHIAWTWCGINSGRDDAELVLYVDGIPVARRAGVRIDVGKIGPRMHIGRDSDGSPDYADAEYDEFYIYSVALSADVIHRAVQDRHRTDVAGRGEDGGRIVHPSWPDADRNCRFEIGVDLPSGPAGPVTARIPLDIGKDLAQLGLAETPRKDSLLVRDAQTNAVVPHAMEGHDLLLNLACDGSSQTRQFIAYFGLNQYEVSRPLAARRRTVPSATSNDTGFEFADYAQVCFGDAWDFEEGDEEGIERWGNKPSFVRNRRGRERYSEDDRL